MRRAVIFDVDDTLLRGENESKAFIEAFDVSYGIKDINTDWSSYELHSDRGIVTEVLEEHFGRKCQKAEIEKIMETYAELLNRATPEIVPGIDELLEALVKRGDTLLALATGNGEKIAKIRLERTGLSHYFSCGGFSDDGYVKVAILGEALDRCSRLWPELRRDRSMVYVGDRSADAVAARTHSVKFIGINPDREAFLGLDVNYVYPDYRDMPGFMETVNRLLVR